MEVQQNNGVWNRVGYDTVESRYSKHQFNELLDIT